METTNTALDNRVHQAPAVGTERLEVLDALRGFALFGVLLVNLRSLSLYGLLPAHAREALPSAPWDRVLAMVNATFVDGAFITMFTLLFGVGFSMQMQRTRHRPGGISLYVRRLLILFAIGVVHAWLLWWGDILRYYALLGLLLIPLARLSTKALAWGGVLMVLLAPVVLQPFLPDLLPQQITPRESADAALVAFGSQQWSDMLHGNFVRDLRMRVAVWMLPTYILGRLMIGAALGRSGVLHDIAAHAAFWRRTCMAAAMVAGSVALLLLAKSHVPGMEAAMGLRSGPGRVLMQVSAQAAPLALGIFYLSAFVLLFQKAPWQRALRWFAPAGRMALSNYLGQTVVAIALFYGVGLGLGPGLGLVGATAIAVAIFLVQAISSRWWLGHFLFGPFEWLWRSLTYVRRQPMRRRVSSLALRRTPDEQGRPP
ncbi:MAG: DUF418 domain-containing protein [Pseudomonadota bacterium]|nr:DUF418 domain-containing protein [Pseudomonadota bacterium]